MIKSPWVWIHEKLTTGIHGVGASTVESASGAQGKVDDHAALTTAHGAVSTATASRIAIRDAAARLAVADGAAAGDAATKGQLDTHAGLTTGVHGLPSSYSGQARKVTTVKSNESGLQCDTLEQLFALLLNKSWYHEDWKNLDKWTSYVTGSGGYDWFSPSDLRLKTGTTISSNSCLDTPQIGPLCLRDPGNQWYFKIQAGSDLAGSEVRLYEPLSTAAKPPSDIYQCVGWKIINGEIYAHTADGTNAKDTDTGISMASIWTVKELLTVCPSEGVIEFYVDGVLKATHSGSGDMVPPHHNGRFSFNIKNTVAADKQIAFHTFNWRS